MINSNKRLIKRIIAIAEATNGMGCKRSGRIEDWFNSRSIKESNKDKYVRLYRKNTKNRFIKKENENRRKKFSIL